MPDQFDPDPLLLPGRSPADPAQAAGFLGNQAANYLGIPEMVKALQGQMTPEEEQQFALLAGLSMVSGMHGEGMAAKGLGSLLSNEGETAVNSILARTAKQGTHYPGSGTGFPFAETPGSIEKITPGEYIQLIDAGGKAGAYLDRATNKAEFYKEAQPLFNKPSARDYAIVGKIGIDPDTSGSYSTGKKNLEWIAAHKNSAPEAEYAKAKAVLQAQNSPWKPVVGEQHIFPEDIMYQDVPPNLPTQIPERATASGYNVPLAHGTRSEEPFEAFNLPEEGARFGVKKAEIGVHAGSPAAANRFGGRDLSGVVTTRPRVYPLVMKAQNPLEMPDLGNWGPKQIEYWLSHEGAKHGFTKDEVTNALKGQPTSEIYKPEGLEQIKALRELIQSKGYDSIKYKNTVEDPGHTSYIALDPKQLRSPWAAFKDLESRNLLAGLAGGAVAAPALTPQIRDTVKALNK